MHAASWERSILCLKGCGWGKRRFISGGRGRFCCSLETERTFIEYSEARRRFVLFHRHVWRKYRNRRDSSSGLPWYRSVCSRDNTAESLHHRPHSGSTTIQSATRILSAQDVSTYLFSYIKRRPWMPANADRIASLQRSIVPRGNKPRDKNARNEESWGSLTGLRSLHTGVSVTFGNRSSIIRRRLIQSSVMHK